MTPAPTDLTTLIRNIGGVIAIIAAVWKLPPMILKWWDRRTLYGLSGGAYSAEDIRPYTEN